MEQFSFQGYWSPAKYDGDPVPGTLEFHPLNGINLELFDPFNGYWEESGMRLKPVESIFGLTSFGGQITLTDCEPAGWSRSMDYKQEYTASVSYEPEFGFIGEHVEGGPRFVNFQVQFSQLGNWIHGAEIGDFAVTLYDDTELTIYYTGFDEPRPFIGQLSGNYVLKFSFDSPRTIQEIISRYIRPIQQLITFGLLAPVFPTKIHGNTISREGISQNAGRFQNSRKNYSFPPMSTSVIYSDPLRRTRPEQDAHGYFDLQLLEGESEQIVKDWFISYNNHRPLFDLYFNSIYYNQQEYPSVTLLNLSRGLEAYHRESNEFSHQYIDSQEFEEYREKLNGTIETSFPNDFKDHLRHGTFRFANRLSLKRRLQDLIDAHEEALTSFIGEDFDSDEMASEIKDIRNNLTHLSNEDVRKFDREAEGSLNWRVKHLTEVILADEVGFPLEIFPWYEPDS